MSGSIHPAAHVDPDADLGDGVEIGPGAVVDADVTIGEGTVVGPHAILYAGTSVGDAVRIHAGVVIGDLPQDLKFEGGESGVEIGDRTVLREYVTVHRCVEPGAVTRVGSDCLLMAYSHVAHECTVGDGAILANNLAMAGHVRIGDRTFVSGNVGIHQFARIGRLAFVAGGSTVRQDVPPFTLAEGYPARLVGLNVVGLRRADWSAAAIRAMKRAYRMLFRSELLRREAIAAVEAESWEGVEEEIAELLDFLRTSERGVSGSRGGGDGTDEEAGDSWGSSAAGS